MALSNMANASNEKRQQNIMRLRKAFDTKQVMTVKAASQLFGYTEVTIRKWCRDGDIPLADPDGKEATVVPLTDDNGPKWLRYE